MRGDILPLWRWACLRDAATPGSQGAHTEQRRQGHKMERRGMRGALHTLISSTKLLYVQYTYSPRNRWRVWVRRSSIVVQSAGRSLPRRRQSGQPSECTLPGLTGGPPAHPTCLHSCWRRMVERDRRVVAPLPPQGLRRWHRVCHPHRHRSAQLSCPTVDLGTSTPTTPPPARLL